MKHFISVFCIVVVLMTAVAMPHRECYAATGRVVRLDYFKDWVDVELGNGHIYVFEGIDDYQLGDIVSMLMDSHGTEDISDDEILDVSYAGFNW